jgi:hypothetical protein
MLDSEASSGRSAVEAHGVGWTGGYLFRVDADLLGECQRALSTDTRVRWIVGGAGSGKSTQCRGVRDRYGIPVIDMDARIYGSFHRLYSPQRHPVSSAWASAGDGLRWLLEMSWDDFDAFNRASLPEYLDLLADELAARPPGQTLLIDGGVSCPALLASVIGPSRVVCLVRRELDSRALWSEPGDRSAMRDSILSLDGTGGLWERFLDFDRRITESMALEAATSGVQLCEWDVSERPEVVLDRLCGLLDLAA